MRTPAQHYDVIVLGGGAAGLMSAMQAGRRGRRTLLIDHAERVGKKILISGGGRCNFTNVNARADNFLSGNPHFAKSALARYTPADFIAMVESHKIPYHEKTLGQLFCDRSAKEIVAMLERECDAANVRILTSTRVVSAEQSAVAQNETGAAGFRINTSNGNYTAESLVVATGGLSIPKMGATGFGYDLARQFGLKIVEPRPGLVPLVFSPDDHDRWCDLTGLSTEVIAAIEGKKGAPKRRGTPAFREKMLITHRGLSGPAILQASSYWLPGETFTVDLAPDAEPVAPLLERNARRDTAAAEQALRAVLPGRLAERWVANHPPRDWTNLSLAAMEHDLHHWSFVPAGTEGFAKAEVTVGGVDTSELDARTMECRAVPGLFFIGEVVDVTGWLGGYNFQWAWASGFSAGQAA